jgi:hypothetical protein
MYLFVLQVLRSKEFPKYFTFRARMNYKEDLVYRHLEPALAFQLELNRLKNYDLHPVPVSNHKVRILCFKFSLNPLRMTKAKKLSNLKNLKYKIDQNSNFDCNLLNGCFCRNSQVTYNCSAFGAIAQLFVLFFVSVSLVRENLRGLRENLKHKIRPIDAFIPCNSEKIELGR